MSALTEETARELIAAMGELSFTIKGLTGVLIEDRDMNDSTDGEAEPTAAPTYMDGDPIGN